MQRRSLRCHTEPVPSPEIRTLKKVLAIVIVVIAYYWIKGLFKKNNDDNPKPLDDKIIVPKKLNHTAQPQKGYPLIHHFDMPEELEGDNSEQSIKRLIDASKKQDDRIDKMAVFERQLLVEHIAQDHRKYGTDIETLLKQNKIYQIQDLNCLRHRKFTSPMLTSHGILSSIRNMFMNDPYDSIQRIFQSSNTKYWNSDGNRLTVFASTNISPYYIRLRMSPEADNQRVSLFGLRIEEDKLAVVKTFSNYFLGWFDLSECDRDGSGSRYLTCVSANCNSGYTFLMLIMEKVIIAQIEIYGQRTV